MLSEGHRSDIGAGPRDPQLGTKIWSFARPIIGMLLVALITFLAADRNSAWDAIERNTHALDIHKGEGKTRHAILDADIERIMDFMDDLADEMRECQLQQQRTMIEVAKLPPDEWEERILENEHNIIEIRVELKKIVEQLEEKKWQ